MLRKLLYFVLFLVAFFMGMVIQKRHGHRFFGGDNRLESVLDLLDNHYVDTLNLDSVHEQVIPLLLSQLDPHSTYLSAKQNIEESERLGGSFEGIGIQFNRMIDTVVVARVIAGGASERAGLKAGDRILMADTARLMGKELSDQDVISRLKGPAGSVVRLRIWRAGGEQTVSVVRGPVPVSSIDASYIMGDGQLYVRLNSWGATTMQEFFTALAQGVMQAGELKGIIIDLRDNSGGYMETAVALASQFLPKDKLVLYAEGRKFPREDHYTEQDGRLMHMPLTVLVNEFSASASEIFAGVMQDHDRAVILGRRTFAKGLVQQPFMLADSSVIRLTVARYYIPSGRSIQKDYTKGIDSYVSDIEERYLSGELFSSVDSLPHTDGQLYHTAAGRKVYGGGGVTPDYLVPRDSVGTNPYYWRLLNSGTLQRFAFEYADKNRDKLSQFSTTDSLITHLETLGTGFLFDYAYYAQAKGIAIRTTYLYESANRLLPQLRALVADFVSADRNAFYRIMNAISPEVQAASTLLKDDQWQPLIYAQRKKELETAVQSDL